MIHIGFTGTQRGMTDAQRERVRQILTHHEYVAHHGDCIGADAEFDHVSRPRAWWMHLHPSTLTSKRAWCELRLRDICDEPRAPLARNRDIVRACRLLIATPSQDRMVLRSGTWTTVRYGREFERHTIIVLPDGWTLTCPKGYDAQA